MKPAVGLSLSLLALTVGSFAPAPALERFEFARLRMGTEVRIVLYAPDNGSARAASDAAYARIDEIEAVMSHYREDSELSRLSARSGSGPVPVSPELTRILKLAQGFSVRSGGSFDITVGPFIELWRKSRRTKQLPDAAELREAAGRVGYRQVVIDESRSSVELRRSRNETRLERDCQRVCG